MKRIILIRHGESEANSSGIYQGQTCDTPLTSLGSFQAIQTAKRLSRMRIDRITASPLTRTRETAQIIADHLALHPQFDSRILETNHGLWEGLDKSTISARWPETLIQWHSNPSLVQFPQGESFTQIVERVADWFKDVSRLSGTTLAVTHDNIIRIAIAQVLSLDYDTIWSFHVHPCAINTIIAFDPPKLICLNDTSHLESCYSDINTHAL